MRVSLCRMGTTAKNAGSQENFTKIDKEYVSSSSPLNFFLLLLRYPLISFVLFRYVVNAAKAAKADKDQRLIYVSVRSLFHRLQPTCYHMLPTGEHGQSQINNFLLAQ